MNQLATMDFEIRSTRAREALAEKKLDALLITNLDNIRWLSGFSGSAGRLVLGMDGATLVTDGRYSGQAEKEIQDSGAQVEVVIENAKQKEVILEAIKSSSASSGASSSASSGSAASKASGRLQLGLEAEDITWENFRTFESKWFGPDTELIPTSGLIAKLRRQKDAGEIARIKKAAQIADRAYEKVGGMLDEFSTEKDIARALDSVMLDFGAEGPSFETIVATGDHSAWAHARPSNREPKEGELLLIDMGALVDGYHSDMTRTRFLGDPPETKSGEVSQKMYEVVLQAQQAGLDTVKAGVSCSEVDNVCRKIIEAAGWGTAFNHSTGHGVGLNIHEQPYVSNKSEDVLLDGEVVTVEPGVYIPPYGGVRIEDTVLVTADGCEILTRTDKQFKF